MHCNVQLLYAYYFYFLGYKLKNQKTKKNSNQKNNILKKKTWFLHPCWQW